MDNYFNELFDKYNVKKILKLNQYQITTIHLAFTESDVGIFNEAYSHCVNSNLGHIVRTKSGALKQGECFLGNKYSYDIVKTNAGIRLTIIIASKAIALTVGRVMDMDKEIAPFKAWQVFVKELQADGIDINDYVISKERAILEKMQIESPPIKMFVHDEVLENVHHIDYHNSFPAGLCNTHPEFRPTIKRLYEKRKEDPVYKAILNYSISGCFQSEKSPWNMKWTHLCKDARNDNNARIRRLSDFLQLNGRKIIGYNTDGIWYQGDVYHGPGEGKDLGKWENDHINCTFRAKSDGAYEFIEDGVYTPVLRGLTTLDMVKPREEWQWGDIYTQEVISYKFIDGEGLVKC